MRRVVAIGLLGVIVFAIACHAVVYSPFDQGFDSCEDPHIVRGARLTIHETGEMYDRVHSRVVGQMAYENRVESAQEANTLFAHSWVTTGYDPGTPNQVTDHASIDAFVRDTDFMRDELYLQSETFSADDSYSGIISQNGKTAIVTHSCSQMGGNPPAMVSWVAVYRIPRGNVVFGVGCGSCGPPVACCPP